MSSSRPPSLPGAQLLQDYRATCYRVTAPGQQIVLRVDTYDAGLAKVLREAWVPSAALLTAYNPGSKARSNEWNESAQAALVRELSSAGHPCLPALNLPDGPSSERSKWTERSVLALGIELPAAHAVAARYGQLAFLWIDGQATPRLITTAAPGP